MGTIGKTFASGSRLVRTGEDDEEAGKPVRATYAGTFGLNSTFKDVPIIVTVFLCPVLALNKSLHTLSWKLQRHSDTDGKND